MDDPCYFCVRFGDPEECRTLYYTRECKTCARPHAREGQGAPLPRPSRYVRKISTAADQARAASSALSPTFRSALDPALAPMKTEGDDEVDGALPTGHK
jgi:hypothetical protein